MYWLVGLISLSLVGIIAMGIYFEMQPPSEKRNLPRWLKGTVGVNLLTFVIAQAGLLIFGVHDAMAQTTAAAAGGELSMGFGLAMLGAGIPTAFATIGAGIAVGPVGAAALAVLSEKPEMFGRSLIYLGLAEGIAIYGLVTSILILGKI